MKTKLLTFAGGIGLLGGVVSASAQTSLLSLYDSPAQTWTEYSYSYTAVDSTTWLTFLFRQDPSFWQFGDVSFTDSGNNQLVENGTFATHDMTDWTPTGQQGLPAGGAVESDSDGYDGGADWIWGDGAVGGVDGLSQAVSTVVGNTYTLSFWLKNDSGPGNSATPANPGVSGTTSFDAFAGNQVGTYDGITINYAGTPGTGGGVTGGGAVPEPSTFALSALGGLGGLVMYRRRK